MSHRQVYRRDPQTGEYRWMDRDAPTGDMRLVKKPRDWRSVAMGVMPSQVKEANAELRNAGISSSAYYDGSGDLVVEGRDRGVRNAVMNLRGIIDRDAGYGDHC